MKKPPYLSFPDIKNDRLLLRQVMQADIPELIDISFYDGKPAQSIEQAMEMQHKIDEDYAAGNSIHWAIVDLETHSIVGTCGYYRGFEQARGELGCVLLPRFRGRGFMSGALRLAINFGFNEMGLMRILAITKVQNLKARTLVDRLGFTKTEEDSNDLHYELKRMPTV